jgi:hypothetical protein
MIVPPLRCANRSAAGLAAGRGDVALAACATVANCLPNANQTCLNSFSAIALRIGASRTRQCASSTPFDAMSFRKCFRERVTLAESLRAGLTDEEWELA